MDLHDLGGIDSLSSSSELSQASPPVMARLMMPTAVLCMGALTAVRSAACRQREVWPIEPGISDAIDWIQGRNRLRVLNHPTY
nr:hypothetical protein [uncultured Halomonas sp.]